MARLLTLWLVALSPIVASAADSWIGQKVYRKQNAVAMVDDKEVDIRLVAFPSIVGDVKGEWLWLGRAWVRKGDVMLTEQALEFFTDEIRQNPDSTYGWGNRATVWGEKGELSKAIKDYDEVVRIDPNSRVVYNNRGAMWRSAGDQDKAIADFNEAIRLDPTYVTPWHNRGLSWEFKGQFDKAIADYTEAIRLDPKHPVFYMRRGWSFFHQGRYDAALKDYTESLRLDPKSAAACDAIAWLKATCPDPAYRNGKESVEYATKACELGAWKLPGDLDALAAAYAEMGDFDNAVKWGEKAVAAITNETERLTLGDHLSLYQQKKPYRDQPKK